MAPNFLVRGTTEDSGVAFHFRASGRNRPKAAKPGPYFLGSNNGLEERGRDEIPSPLVPQSLGELGSPLC